jgi:amino acid transporter
VSVVDIIRAVVTVEEVIVLILYSVTAIGLVTYRRQTEQLREGRFALFVAIVCLLSISIYDEYLLRNRPAFDAHEVLQQIAAIGLVIGWWRIIGLRFENLPVGVDDSRLTDRH